MSDSSCYDIYNGRNAANVREHVEKTVNRAHILVNLLVETNIDLEYALVLSVSCHLGSEIIATLTPLYVFDCVEVLDCCLRR